MATLIGSCVNLNGELISNMVDSSEDIEYEDLLEYVNEAELECLFPTYEWNNGRDLKLKDDFAVGYHKSTYGHMDCVYLDHSSIEYVWVIN